MWQIARSGVRAHRGAYVGTAAVLAVAAALVAVTGVLLESGIRTQASGDALSGSMLVALSSSYAGTALLVVVMVVASTVSLALRSRRREFALLRAVGTTPSQVRAAVTAEVVLVAAASAPLGAVGGLLGARLLDPLLVRGGIVDQGFRSPLSPWPVLAAVLLVVATAVPVGRLAARESARMAPTDALRTSAVEPRALGRGRRLSAVVLAAVGLASAFSPLFVPGALGSATAAVSAFFLVGAGALAGPLVVGWVFDRLARVRAGAAPTLAVANLRGFSRRLTTVVVPLALVVAAATAQTSVNAALATAGGEQLTAALGADLVVTGGPAPLAPDAVAQVAADPGVAQAAPLGAVPAQVRSGGEDTTFAGSLEWEATALQVVTPEAAAAGLVDPGVEQGSLAALAEPGTIAISTDAAMETGARLDGTVLLRLGDREVEARVVAVYSRGLGLGGYLTGPATPASHGVDPAVTAVLVDVAPGADAAQVAARLAGLAPAATVGDVAGYVAAATASGAGETQLSTALLLLLLGVVAVGAVSTLALTTASRRDELALLHRTGTTRRQLTAMTTVESVVTAATAWVLGTVAVIPAVVGVSAGLLGARLVVDLVTYGLVSAGVVVLAVAATAVASRRTTRVATAVVAA